VIGTAVQRGHVAPTIIVGVIYVPVLDLLALNAQKKKKVLTSITYIITIYYIV